MVLVHKLKQMEELDVAQFQDGDAAQPKDAQTKAAPSTQKRRPVLPARRPTTRSQTGVVTKRPDKELSAPVATRTLKRNADQNSLDTPTEKRQKRSNTAPPQPSEPQPSTPVKSSEVAVAPEPIPDSTTQGPFISESEALDRRGPKSRAVLPIPVPNLTKKSRGRRVPTTTTASVQQETPTTRNYVCKVEHCGKCFNRGEHLKRHIRSIHTHEKPFECSHPDCDKFFNRHDNLLQHLKVHKDLPAPSSTPPVGPGPLQLNSRAAVNNGFESSSPSPPASPPTRASVLPQSYIAYPANGPYSAPSTSSFSRNMVLAVSSLRTDVSCVMESPSLRAEVSSLRTEMPHSPPREMDENDRSHHNADADHRGGSFNSEGPRKSYYRLPPPIPRLQPTVTAMTHNWQS